MIDENVLYATADEVGRVPIRSVVNAGKVERLFCELAHEFVRPCNGRWISFTLGQVAGCTHLCGAICGLTGCRHLCLFYVPDDPQWARIRQSVALASATATSG